MFLRDISTTETQRSHRDAEHKIRSRWVEANREGNWRRLLAAAEEFYVALKVGDGNRGAAIADVAGDATAFAE